MEKIIFFASFIILFLCVSQIAVTASVCEDKDIDGYDNCTLDDPGDTDGLPEDCDDNDPNTYPEASEICDGKDNDCDGSVDEYKQYDNCQPKCENAGYTWTGNGGKLNCCGNDDGEDSPYEATETTCNDGNDNDCDGFVDCNDNDCVGQTGPNGDECCSVDSDCSNYGYSVGCGFCDADKECNYWNTSVVCNPVFKCSDSIGGDNKYDAYDYKKPSQGYCDGQGNCDWCVTGETSCDLAEGAAQEGTGLDICVDGESSCVDTCSDGLDNDNDGYIDAVDSDCSNILIHSPIPDESYERKVLVDVSITEVVKYFYMSINDGIFRKLCRDCNSVTREFNMPEGKVRLRFKKVLYDDEIEYRDVRFIVDSREPTIRKISPKEGSYVSCLTDFEIEYSEDTVSSVSLFYGTNPFTEHSIDCKSGKRKTCSASVDLSVFAGQEIEYYFMVSSPFHTDTSKRYKLFVDCTDPIVTLITPENKTYDSRRVRLNISVSEEVKLEYSDNNGRFRRLWSNCDSYNVRRYFKYGSHELIIRATDKAGNEGYASVIFTVV